MATKKLLDSLAARTKEDPVEILSTGISRLEERKRLAAELAAKTWKTSEIADLEELLREQEDGASKLAILYREVERARKAGRVIDDTTPIWANVRSWFPPEQWVLTSAEVGLCSDLAASMDEETRIDRKVQYEKRQQYRPGLHPDGDFVEVPDTAPRVPVIKSYKEAAIKWSNDLLRTKAANGAWPISREQHWGILSKAALPPWIPWRDSIRTMSSGPGMTTRYATPEEEERSGRALYRYQVVRWEVWEQVRRIILAGWLDDKRVEVPALKGFHWPAVSNLDLQGEEYWKGYMADTRQAQWWLKQDGEKMFNAAAPAREADAEKRIRQDLLGQGMDRKLVEELIQKRREARTLPWVPPAVKR